MTGVDRRLGVAGTVRPAVTEWVRVSSLGLTSTGDNGGCFVQVRKVALALLTVRLTQGSRGRGHVMATTEW